MGENATGPAEDPLDARMRLSSLADPLRSALICLSPRRPDRRPAAAVQELELDAGRVDCATHEAAERVYLPDQWPLAVPPTAGLHGMCADGFSRSVHNPTYTPARAAAQAASTPAWPAPTTMTSNSSLNFLSMTHFDFR